MVVKYECFFSVFPSTMLQTVSEWLWWERLWLPANVSWSDLEDSEGRVYAKASQLYAALPCAFCLLLVRYLFERWEYAIFWSIFRLCCTSCVEQRCIRPLLFRKKKSCAAVPDNVLHSMIWWPTFTVMLLLQVPGHTTGWCLGNQGQCTSHSRPKPRPRKLLLQTSTGSITGVLKRGVSLKNKDGLLFTYSNLNQQEAFRYIILCNKN